MVSLLVCCKSNVDKILAFLVLEKGLRAAKQV